MPPATTDERVIKGAKLAAAKAALKLVRKNMLLGVGTGSTVNLFIELLASSDIELRGAVPSSQATRQALEKHNLPIVLPQQVESIPLYIDGADQINHDLEMIKGGGGALTGEKILAHMSQRVVCIADENKYVREFNHYLPIEIVSFGYSLVCAEMKKLGGDPRIRKNYLSDYGNPIIDVYDLKIWRAKRVESIINEFPGVISNGLFALRPADQLLLGLVTGKVTTIGVQGLARSSSSL